MTLSRPRPGICGRLDEEDVAADRSDRQAGRNSGILGPLPDLAREASRPEPRPRAALVDARRPLGLPLGHTSRRLPAERGDLALEVPDARLPRVLADHRAKRPLGEAHLVGLQSVRLELLRDEVALRDAELLVLGVAREMDDVHPVEERPRNRLELIRGADEEHLREVERKVEVVVAEGGVLLGVEHLEHRAGGIAAEVRAHLVDLVDQEDRVARLGVAKRADDRARHGADVGAAVPPDLRLVVDAADGDPRVLALQRPRDGLAERGLADAGRADEAEDRAGDVAAQLRDGEVLDDPLLDLLQVEVVLVQHLTRVREIEVVLRRLRPGQRQDPVDVGADHAVLGRGSREALEASQFAVDGLARLLRQVGRLDPLAQLADLRLLGVALAELLLDRLHLLAQEELALALLHLRLDLRLDLGAELEDLQLAVQDP